MQIFSYFCVMASNTGSPRLEITIDAITSGLKKGLEDARKELKNFNDEVKRGGSSDFKNALQAEKVALAQSKTEAQQARTEIAKLALAKKQGQSATVALSGSYREAQQRLTALGRSIREAQGGFTNTTPAIRAQISEYNRLNDALKKFDAQMGNHYRNVGNYGSALSSLSPQLSMLAGKGGGYLSLAFAVKSAYDTISTFDSGLRNVEKTTGLTRKETQALGKEFVNLSKDLKVIGANQLTQYATIAGQLGVKGTKDILAFTEALAKLETASNIRGEEGGSEIARTLTLVDGGVQNVKAFGDEIVNLGNNFAATEKEILGNAESIAQNVGIYRIGRQDVLAYATATKSVGIEAELVGSTFNRTLAIFESAIRTGDGLKTILGLIGGTQAELSKRFKQDASGVFLQFIGALNNVYKSGGSVNEQLEKIGVNAVRDQRVIQSLAANGYDVLTRAMETAKNASGALDAEFETASGKMTQQIGRIKVSWDNLVLSMEEGTGIIGNISVAFASASADIIDGFNNIVSSRSFKEFFVRLGELSSDGTTRAISNAYGNAVKSINENQSKGSRGLVSYKEMKSFYDLDEAGRKKALDAQQKIVEAQSKEFQLNKDNLKVRDNLLWNAEKLAKMRQNLAKPADSVLPVVAGTGGGGDDRGKKGGKTPTKISDILGDLAGEEGNDYDKRIAKINQEYTRLVEKINQSVGEKADISEALRLAKVKRDFDELKVSVDRSLDSVKKFTASNGISLSGSLTTPRTLPGLARAQERLNRPITSNLTDEFSKQFTSTLRRGLASTFNDLFSNISNLSEGAYEIEKKYADLRANATAEQIAGLNKMEALERKINNGLTNMLTKMGNTFTSIAGNMLSSALSTGISSGDFSDLTEMFKGNKKGVGYGAAASLLGGALGSVFKPSDTVGQTLSGALAGLGSGVAIGTMIGGPLGTILGGVGGALIGGLTSLFGASKRKREEELMELQLAEQRKLVALSERQAALAYTSSIIGQMTNQGYVTSVDRDEFGNLVATLKGSDIALALERTKSGRG